jgi:hypothetical protein
VNDIMSKINANERMVGIGAIVVIVGWVIGLGSFGVGGGIFSIGAAVAALVLIYLKYAPNTNINWPAPVSLFLLICGGLCLLGGILSTLAMLAWLGIGVWGGFFAITWIIQPIALLVGGAIMTYAAYKEYTANKPA